MEYERRCWKCEAQMARMVTDGIERWVCPACGVTPRKGRPRTQRGMRASRAADRMSYGHKHRKI